MEFTAPSQTPYTRAVRRTIIFGAGASAPFYEPELLTPRLSEHLRRTDMWEAILDRYNALDRGSRIDVDDVLSLILRIAAVNPRMNFEDFIGLLDKICGYNLGYGAQRPALHDLLHYYNAKPTLSATSWADVPFLARHLLTEHLIGAKRSAAYDSLLAHQTKLLRGLADAGELNIYSLNYDEPVPNSTDTLPFITGFETGNFDPASFFSASNVVAYPHGHARFRLTAKGMHYDSDVMRATCDRFDLLLSATMDEPVTTVPHAFAPDFDTFITTGRTKEHSFDHNPFAAYYQRLAIDLPRSDELFIIGYSFGDPHINRFLTNYLLDPRHRVMLITLHKSPIDLLERFKGQEPPAATLRALGFDRIALDPANDGRAKHQGDVDHLNIDEYGTLERAIAMDKRGYGTFLHDQEPALAALANVRMTP